MEIVVAGSHGLIGRAVVGQLRAQGHRVRCLVRRKAHHVDEYGWDPRAGVLNPAGLVGADAVINLAGAGIADHRWTAAYREEIVSSRLQTTVTLADAMGHLDQPPPVWLQGTAIGVYGDRGAEELTEAAAPGSGFLPDLVQRWEEATSPAVTQGVRVVQVRTGIVLAPQGGTLGKLLPIVRSGLGGRLGHGHQYFSWISLADEVAAIIHLLTAPIHGPVNLVAPQSVTNAEFIAALARALGRRAPIPVPRWALRIALGEVADDLLSSQRVIPRVLSDAGFRFAHPDLPTAVTWVLQEQQRHTAG